MTEKRKSEKPAPKIEELELSKETVQDLTAEQAERAGGGRAAAATDKDTCACSGNCTATCFICR